MEAPEDSEFGVYRDGRPMTTSGSGSRPPATVLVTGASGFIGRHLVARLLAEGAHVHGSSRKRRRDHDVCWHQTDLGDEGAVQALVRRVAPDAIFHLSGRVTGSRDLREVQHTFDANLKSTVNVLAAASRRHCGRVVLTGSTEEVGGNGGLPGSGYAASKIAASAYTRLFSAVYELSVVNLRVSMVYGPGQLDGRKLVPYTITSLLRNEVPLVSSGDRPVDWVYVDDVVSGLLAAAVATAGDDGSSIDIGSGELVTIRDLISSIRDRIQPSPAPSFGAVPDRPHESMLAADLTRARRELSWEPTTPLAEGLDATIAWYRARLRASNSMPPVVGA
jgi:UDP-glucose 4-epimerase